MPDPSGTPTPIYGIPTWTGLDKLTRAAFNNILAAIDSAVGAQAGYFYQEVHGTGVFNDSLTVATIPQNGKDLHVQGIGRATGLQSVGLLFNADNTGHYLWGGGGGLNEAFTVGSFCADTEPAGLYGVIDLTVYDYADATRYKRVRSTAMVAHRTAVGPPQIFTTTELVFDGIWIVTNAITRVDLGPSPTGTFTTDSLMRVWVR